MQRMKKVRWQVWLITNYGQPILPTVNDTRKDCIDGFGREQFEIGLQDGRLKVEKFMLEKRPTE